MVWCNKGSPNQQYEFVSGAILTVQMQQMQQIHQIEQKYAPKYEKYTSTTAETVDIQSNGCNFEVNTGDAFRGSHEARYGQQRMETVFYGNW